MLDYPTSLPVDAVAVVINRIRGGDVPLSQLLLAGWNLQGYGMNQISGSFSTPQKKVPPPGPVGASVAQPPEHVLTLRRQLDAHEELDQGALEALACDLEVLAKPGRGVKAAAGFSWQLFLPIILDLIGKWLAG